MFSLFLLTARISWEPISPLYLDQIHANGSTAIADQAILWALAELGSRLDKTVTMDEVVREISYQVYNSLDSVDVSHKLMSWSLQALSDDIAKAEQTVDAVYDAMAKNIEAAMDEFLDSLMDDVEDFLDQASNTGAEFEPLVLKKMRRNLKAVVNEAPWVHHVLFFGFQILFVTAICYYNKLMRQLRMY